MLYLLLALACRTKDFYDSGVVLPEDDTGRLDGDGDGVAASEDCDDDDATVYPGATEQCNGVDDDCDGEVDEEAQDATLWYTDEDGDGHGAGVGVSACEAPEGFVAGDGDCDDADPAYHPGAEEDDCTDPNDYNCDGSTGFADADGDGFPACEDCNDAEAEVNSDADEVCDGIDNNCDSTVDEDEALDASTWYADGDEDGYGDADSSTASCEQPEGYVSDATDCNDSSDSVSPGATEYCNSVDDDCDGTIDEDDANDAATWYADTDGDGYGDSKVSQQACAQPSGWISDDTDCDDSDTAVNPGATEYCNSIDDDCDGSLDEDDAADASTWYTDSDGDGFGDATTGTNSCAQPSGTVADATDCDDTDADENPDADEICDGDDDDCDGTTDEDDAIDADTWYADTDGDGYGDASTTTQACNLPTGFVADDSDCDDGDSAITDGDDWYLDDDCDGYGDASNTVRTCSQPSGYVEDDTDCDDADGRSNPGATEICLSSGAVDHDCDGTADNNSCLTVTEIGSPTYTYVDSPTFPGSCGLIGELNTGLNTHAFVNLPTFMAALEATSNSATVDATELDYSCRCGSDYSASPGNYGSTNAWPSLTTSSQGAARFRGYLNVTCDDPLDMTLGLIGNDAVILTIEGTTVMQNHWTDGQWKKFRHVSFPEPGLYAFEIQWSTNLVCGIDPMELVWADGFVSGYGSYDTMCSYASCTYGDNTVIPGFSIVDGDMLVQTTGGVQSSCVQCASSSDCASGETCNSAGVCE